jgi:hypothetical protein
MYGLASAGMDSLISLLLPFFSISKPTPPAPSQFCSVLSEHLASPQSRSCHPCWHCLGKRLQPAQLPGPLRGIQVLGHWPRTWRVRVRFAPLLSLYVELADSWLTIDGPCFPSQLHKRQGGSHQLDRPWSSLALHRSIFPFIYQSVLSLYIRLSAVSMASSPLSSLATKEQSTEESKCTACEGDEPAVPAGERGSSRASQANPHLYVCLEIRSARIRLCSRMEPSV